MTTDSQDPVKNPLLELEAMKAVAAALGPLDTGGVGRVLRWAAEAYGAKVSVHVSGGGGGSKGFEEEAAGGGGGVDLKSKYPALADLYSAAGPTQETDKALVVGYWLQNVLGVGDFDSQTVNGELKNLGHGVANITSAFDGLMARKPQLVIQTKKSGTTRQARKKYKLTLEGQRSVERMIGGVQE